MRQMIVNVLAFICMGWLFAYMGYNFLTWEFWVMLGLLLVIQVNSGVRSVPGLIDMIKSLRPRSI